MKKHKNHDQAPDLSHMSTNDLCAMMLACGMSSDESDRDFVKACRDEIARRKPERRTPSTKEQND